MRNLILSTFFLLTMQPLWAETVPFGQGQLTVKYVARNAVRIQYDEGGKLPMSSRNAKESIIFCKASFH